MKFWHHLRTWLTSSAKPVLRVAIICPRSSSSTEKYINFVIQHLKGIVSRPPCITQFSNIADEKEFALMIRDAKERHFDVVVAIGCAASLQARRIYTEHGLFIPTLLIAYKDLLPHPLPQHISGLLLPNSAHFLKEVINNCFTQLNHIIIAGCSNLIKNLPELEELTTQLRYQEVKVTQIKLDQAEPLYTAQLKQSLPTADLIFLPNDSHAFQCAATLIPLAHQYNCPVIASELHALKFGADLAIGYPLDSIALETAHQIDRIIRQPKGTFHHFKTAQEVHCHAGGRSEWLNGFITKNTDYNFKIIGAKDSVRSEQSPPMTLGQ